MPQALSQPLYRLSFPGQHEGSAKVDLRGERGLHRPDVRIVPAPREKPRILETEAGSDVAGAFDIFDFE